MSDIITVWNPTLGLGDWVLPGLTDAADLPESSEQSDLATAVLISLFSDATADDDDVAPDGAQDPRGWWAGPIGSKIWLRMRAKKTAALLAIVQADIVDALQWLIEDGVASSIDVLTEWTPPSMLGAQVTITRATGASENLKFAWAWKDQ